MKIRAFAKVNMVLEILGMLQNNDSLNKPYHNTSGIYQNIDLFDLIEIKESKFDVIKTINLEIPESQNLVTIALNKFKRTFNITNSFEIQITKNIPISSGLGGGSTNAAAVIYSLNKELNLGLSMDELCEFSYNLGSDIPFFFLGGTCKVFDGGKKVEKIECNQLKQISIYSPDINVECKTERMFKQIISTDYGSPKRTISLAKKLERGEEILPDDIFNVFSKKVINLYPELIRPYRNMIKHYGNCSVSGAGMTLFSLIQGDAKGDLAILDGTYHHKFIDKGMEFVT